MTKRDDELARKQDAENAKRFAALKGPVVSLSDSEISRRVKQLRSNEPAVPQRKRPATLDDAPDVADVLNQVYDEIDIEDRVAARNKRSNAHFDADVKARLAALNAPTAAKVTRPAPTLPPRASQSTVTAKNKAQEDANLEKSLAALRNKAAPTPAAQPVNPTPPPARPAAAPQPTRYYPSTWVSPNPTPPAVEEKTGFWNFIKRIGRAIVKGVSSLFSSAPKAEQERAQPPVVQTVQQTITEPSVNKPRSASDILKEDIAEKKIGTWRNTPVAPAAAKGHHSTASEVKTQLNGIRDQVPASILTNNSVVTEEHTTSHQPK